MRILPNEQLSTLLALYIILLGDVPLLKSDFCHDWSSLLSFRSTFSELRRNLIHEIIHVTSGVVRVRLLARHPDQWRPSGIRALVGSR